MTDSISTLFGILVGVFVSLFLLLVREKIIDRRNQKELSKWTDKHNQYIAGWEKVNGVFSEIVNVSRENMEMARASRLQAENLFTTSSMLLRSKSFQQLSDVELLLLVPGVGEKTADNLLKKFGSAKDVFTASVDELLSVKKVGQELAVRIKTFHLT